MKQSAASRKIIKHIDNKITELRNSVRYAGDSADIVYIGGRIGRLKVARKIIDDETYDDDDDEEENSDEQD